MSIISSISFLSSVNRTFDTEKPYSLKFPPPDGLPKTNIRSHSHDQHIEDVRGQEERFSLGKNGFAIIQLQSRIQYEDFSDDSKIVDQYLPQVAETLREMFGASRVQIFEHLVYTSTCLDFGENRE